ncbi:MAG: class I SAM-dependent methyltransferase [Rhodospirillaceae bacterium]
MANRQTPHDMLPNIEHDENARQDFVFSFRRHLARQVNPGTTVAYENRVEPAFEKAYGRKPVDHDEVRKVMVEDPYYQIWSCMQRNSQMMMWDSVIDSCERTLPEMIEKARGTNGPSTLKLADDDFELPRYHTSYDIHLQPGGYHTDNAEDDIAAGMIYDTGVPIYAMGMMGPENDATGETLVNYYKNTYPDRTPERVLDLGCAIGNSTVPWAKAYPDTEVHGIDVAAPCLRYGQARANAMGHTIHLSQQNAEKTDFPDNHFAVIVSALLFHETARQAVTNIMTEMHRILKPGGVMVHMDAFNQGQPNEPIQEFLATWEVFNNNEYFLKQLRSIDIIDELEACGFERTKCSFQKTPYITTTHVTEDGTKGYMAGGFRDINVLVAEK